MVQHRRRVKEQRVLPRPAAASPRRRPAFAEALKPEDESNIVFFQISGCLALGQMIIPHQSLTRLFKRFS